MNKKVCCIQTRLDSNRLRGEKLEEREAGQTKMFVEVQTEAALQVLAQSKQHKSLSLMSQSGLSVQVNPRLPQDANEVCALYPSAVAAIFTTRSCRCSSYSIRRQCETRKHEEYMGQADIDGALVGGASLRAGFVLALVEGAK